VTAIVAAHLPVVVAVSVKYVPVKTTSNERQRVPFSVDGLAEL